MHRSPVIRGLLRRWMRVRPVFVGLAVLLIFACGEEGGGKPISAEELLDRLNAGNVSLVLDVRSAGEFETIHIAGGCQGNLLPGERTAIEFIRATLPVDLPVEGRASAENEVIIT